jgi:4-hydroxyphenylpyruvate dioxygenase
VQDAHKAYARALELGRPAGRDSRRPDGAAPAAIKGIGGAPLYLIDRFEDGKSIYDIDFEWLPGVSRHPKGLGLKVAGPPHAQRLPRPHGALGAVLRAACSTSARSSYFDIKGEYTGLTSKAMTGADGLIRIPLNEEAGKTSGQIEEFLMKFSGEGIQHVALLPDNLIETVDQLQMAGVPLMTAPNDIYYEMLEERLPGHGQPVGELQARGILLDGTPRGGRSAAAADLLETMLGPVFFEFIQRAGDDGFGNGNFKALFESLERDQIRRGVLQVG